MFVRAWSACHRYIFIVTFSNRKFRWLYDYSDRDHVTGIEVKGFHVYRRIRSCYPFVTGSINKFILWINWLFHWILHRHKCCHSASSLIAVFFSSSRKITLIYLLLFTKNYIKPWSSLTFRNLQSTLICLLLPKVFSYQI